ncbi:MAG: site-specific integrase [Ignavibacteria bacterium]|nr:site-specific integrase [Ignavibacteria bacterium]
MSIKVREKSNKSGSISLYLDVYHKGKRHYEFLDLKLIGDRKQDKEILLLANSIRAKRELELKNGEFGFKTQNNGEANFLLYFEKVRERKSQSLGTWRTTLYHLKNFIRGDGLKFQDITPSWLEEFKAYLVADLSPNTARNFLACVSHVLKQAVKDDIITTNPADKVDSIKAKDAKRDFLTFEEMQRFSQADCLDPEVKRAFLFSCYCGLRLGDIRSLLWRNIKDDNSIELVQGKTKEALYIPLHQEAITLLGARGKPDDLVFTMPSDSQLSLVMKVWTANARINKTITFHCARHTFATLALTSNVPIYTVSKLLGHSRLETTQVYANMLASTKKSAVDSLPSLSGKS